MNRTNCLRCCTLLAGCLIVSVPALASSVALDASSADKTVDPPPLHPIAPLILKNTIPGTPVFGLAGMPNGAWGIDYKIAFDFNDDGIPETMRVADNEDTSPPNLFEIIDGANPENAHTVCLMEDEGILYFIRFSELDATSDLKDMIFAKKRGRRYVNPIVVDADGNLLSVWDDTDVVHLLAIADVDGDAYDDVIVLNAAMSQVEIWGGSSN